jgi:hypothetical protein
MKKKRKNLTWAGPHPLGGVQHAVSADLDGILELPEFRAISSPVLKNKMGKFKSPSNGREDCNTERPTGASLNHSN